MALRPVLATLVTAFVGMALSTCGPTEAPTPSEPDASPPASVDPASVTPAAEPEATAAPTPTAEPVVDPAATDAPNEAEPAAPCPEDMVLVQGEHCFLYEQVCLRWDDPEGQPRKRVCAKFQEPSTCTSRRHAMRFCIDRDEYHVKGESLPMSGVSWQLASKICNAQGKRLCRNVEWEFACEGEQGLPYPYGYERTPSLCNIDRLLRDGKFHAKNDLREPPHATCVSPFGVRDMVGNVDEWVSRPFHPSPNRSELRGGWWMTGRNRCRANTTSHDERYSDRQTGFRCCKGLVDEPADAEATEAAPPPQD